MRNITTLPRAIFCGLALLPLSCAPGDVASFNVQANYDKADYYIPMRDGVELYTIVYSPKDDSQDYAILLYRTPYSIPPYGADEYRSPLGPSVEFDREGFIFVFQDVRETSKSGGGDFIVIKPYNPNKRSPQDADESSDTYDTIEWLLENIPNHNGRVGQWGVSYPGWQTALGMIDAHPALIASSPQASVSDMWIGDDFHHNGAFRLAYTFNWLNGMARHRTPERDSMGVRERRRFDYPTPDGYQFFLDIGPVSNVNTRYFKGEVYTWNEYMEHGDYDEYWKAQEIHQYMNNIDHAILNVAGWFDAEDFYGPLGIYFAIEERNPNNNSTLVVGPWRHGGWNRDDGDQLGDIRFGSKTGEYFRRKVQFPFFNYHLNGKGELNLPEALVFETGSNEWKSYDHWPPAEAEEQNLYLNADGKLSFSAPSATSSRAFDSFVSDPDNPVPHTAEIRSTMGALWMIEDQRFAARRPDVLVYQSEVLTEDITIAGPIIASLYVSTTGTDADWIVKLIDVYPPDAPDNEPNPGNVRMGDFQMLVGADVMRGKYRNSFSAGDKEYHRNPTIFSGPEPFIPNRVTKVEWDLRDKYHTFLRGHRIMVQIQSTWFPAIDRNPQKFVDIYHAREADFQKATHRVYRSAMYPSHVKLSVLP